jgi:hypothetical protein
MRFRRTIVIVILLLSGVCRGALTKQVVLPLRIVDGEPNDDGRIFGVDVFCNSVPGTLELGCFGQSRISESFARQCAATIEPELGDNIERDPDGKPVMAGTAKITLKLAELEFELPVHVMRDIYCEKSERQGMIGLDVFSHFQWEIDPTKPTLTLRPIGTPPRVRPLAMIPITLNNEAVLVRARIRNRTEELALLPGTSFIQVGPSFQKAWDFNTGQKMKLDVNRYGEVRTAWLHGDDSVELAPGFVKDTDLRVAIMPARRDGQTVTSGLGQCLLNRFVYCVEPKRGQLRIMSRVAGPTTRPRQR